MHNAARSCRHCSLFLLNLSIPFIIQVDYTGMCERLEGAEAAGVAAREMQDQSVLNLKMFLCCSGGVHGHA